MKKENENQGFVKKRFTFSTNKRTVILFSGIVLILLAVAAVFIFLPKQDENLPNDQIYYYPARYDEDIFKNQAYLSFEKGLLYSEAGVTRMYYPNAVDTAASPECRFFLDYFQAVINGNYQEISDFYVEGYFEETPKFTMQMIYEPYVLFHSVNEEEVDGETISVYNFEVRYKIFKNNGTFRTGVPSNTAIPQIYQLIKENERYQIVRILDVEYEN